MTLLPIIIVCMHHSFIVKKLYPDRLSAVSGQTENRFCSRTRPFLRKDILELEEQEYKNAQLYESIKSKLLYHIIKRKGADHTAPNIILVIDDSDSDSSSSHVSGGSVKQQQVYAKVANPVPSLQPSTPDTMQSSMSTAVVAHEWTELFTPVKKCLQLSGRK